MELEEHKMSPEMNLFFTKLLDIKHFVKAKYEETQDETLHEIYQKLDEIIKEKGN